MNRNSLRGGVAALTAMVGLSASALGQLDTEAANNTFAGADDLALAVGQARLNLAGLGGGGGDVDFFSNFLLTNETYVMMTTPLASLPANFQDPDTVMGGFRPAGTLVHTNDDAGADFVGPTPLTDRGSAMRYRAFGSGTHAFGVSGFADFGFAGTHTRSGAYAITTARFSGSPSVGGDFNDSAVNSVVAGADSLNLAPLSAVTAVAELATGGGDVDFFSVFMNAGEVLSAMTTPFGSQTNFASPDTMLGVFDSGGVLVGLNDDAGSDIALDAAAGPSRGSVVRFMATSPGLYYLAVTGFNDSNFDGLDGSVPHDEAGLYGLTASLIPTPSAAALLGLGLLGVARRRRS